MQSESSSVRLLVSLILAHFLIDTVATVINPLWPTLQEQTASGDVQFLWLFIAWNVANSVTQIGFGLIGDRIHGHWLLWLGPAVAVVCLSLLGLTQSLPLLCVLVSFAGLGIAAFHPEAASLAGNCLPSHRSRALSLFQLGGFLGQTAGPYYSGQIVNQWGMRALLPGLIWTLVLIAGMRLFVRPESHSTAAKPAKTVPLAEIFRGQWLRLAILLAVGVLRIIPAAGVPMALAFLESARGSSTADIGLIQSAFTFGIGGGGLLCGVFLPRDWEKPVLWLLPLAAAPIIFAIPSTHGPTLLIASATAGLLLGSTLPILISLGQQTLPKSQRVGSSITMGLSWGLGGGIAGAIVLTLKPSSLIVQAFPLFALCAVLSSALCATLLRPEPAAIPAKAGL